MKNNLKEVWTKHANEIYGKNGFHSKKFYLDYGDLIVQWMVDISKKKNKKLKLLDVGCGIGQYVKIAKELKFVAKGLDISEEAVKIARKNNLDVVLGDMRKLPFKDNSFDIVVAGGSIEHFPETQQALKEINRVLRPGGILIGNVPNRYTIFVITKKIQQSLGIWRLGYEKSFSVRKFKNLLIKHNFQVNKMIRRKIAQGKHKILSKIIQILDKPFFLAGQGGAHFYFYATKNLRTN